MSPRMAPGPEGDATPETNFHQPLPRRELSIWTEMSPLGGIKEMFVSVVIVVSVAWHIYMYVPSGNILICGEAWASGFGFVLFL